MPRWVSILVQSLATAGQVANAYGGLLPEQHRVAIGVGLGIGQIVVGTIAHSYNPDGTLATVAYVKGGDPLAPPKSPLR